MCTGFGLLCLKEGIWRKAVFWNEPAWPCARQSSEDRREVCVSEAFSSERTSQPITAGDEEEEGGRQG